MNQTKFFALLCEMEAHIHMIKANSLLKNNEQQLAHLLHLQKDIRRIVDECISGDSTQLYIAK